MDEIPKKISSTTGLITISKYLFRLETVYGWYKFY